MAVLVYLTALLIVGIKIVFASTGDSKAKYKDVFQAWVTGVMLLCLFPYVMKYTVKLNNVLVEMINTDLSANNANPDPTPIITPDILDNASDSFGEANYTTSISGSPFVASEADAKKDMMLYIRELACNLGKMSLTFVYFVMLGELIVILFVYYKRVFMMAFLITIFPLIVIMYIVEKLTSGSSKAFSTWFKEYLVLVFTQSFHAAVYVVIVNAGVQVYITQDNWLFMLLCIIFLFQGEKILRSIFGMTSSANTISDLAAAGMVGFGMAKNVAGILKKDEEEKTGEEKDLEEAKEKSAPKQPQTANQTGANAGASGSNSQGNAGEDNNNSQDEGNSKPKHTAPQDVTNDPNANFEAAQNLVRAKALEQRRNTKKGRGVAGKIGTAMKISGAATGATLGLAAGLAQGDVNKAVSNAAVGVAVGKGVGNLASAPIRGISNAYRGKKLKKKIMSGNLDKEFKELGFDLASLDTETQKMFREALADLGSGTATGGKVGGELKMLETTKKIHESRTKE